MDRGNLPFKVVDREGTLFSPDFQFSRLILSLVLIYSRRWCRLQVTTFGDREVAMDRRRTQTGAKCKSNWPNLRSRNCGKKSSYFVRVHGVRRCFIGDSRQHPPACLRS